MSIKGCSEHGREKYSEERRRILTTNSIAAQTWAEALIGNDFVEEIKDVENQI